MGRLRIAVFCCATLILSTGSISAQTDAPTPIPAPGFNEIPQGKTLLLRLGQRLETRTARPGQRFKASLAEDLVAPSGNGIARGSKVRGHISRTSEGLHPRLLLSFDEIQTSRGWEPLIATVTNVPGEHGVKPDGDGSIAAGSRSSESDDESRSPWARIGGVAGFFSDHSVRLEKGTILEIRLDRGLPLPRR